MWLTKLPACILICDQVSSAAPSIEQNSNKQNVPW